jgi:hypothetical protein
MGEVDVTEAVLARTLLKARVKYLVLEAQELLGIGPCKREIYFRHSTLLKQLISSIESFLDDNQRLEQPGESLRNRRQGTTS